MVSFDEFLKTQRLGSNSVTRKMVEHAEIRKSKCDILIYFQTVRLFLVIFENCVMFTK